MFEQRQAASVAEAERQPAEVNRQTEEALALRQTQLQEIVAEHESKVAVLNALIHEKTSGFAFVAQAWADYETALAGAQADLLDFKDYPAPRAAEFVRMKGAELARVRRQAKLSEWIINLYEFHFPWLVELREIDEEEGYLGAEEATGTDSDVAAPDDPASPLNHGNAGS